MPNRILREGILTSPRVARLGGWAEEVFYRRLMSVVDDFGRYYADAGMIRAACYPRQLSKVSDSDIGKWLTACVNAALVRVYPASDGESYLQLLDFKQQARATKSKFPDPCAANATQERSVSAADAPVFVFESVDEVVDASGAAVAALWEEFWKAYPKKKSQDDARKAFEKRKPTRALLDSMLQAIREQSQTAQWQKDGGQYIPHPATWLNDGAWQDEDGVRLPAAANPQVAETRARLSADAQRKLATPGEIAAIKARRKTEATS